MLVHIVADYGPAGDLAFAEVVQPSVPMMMRHRPPRSLDLRA